MDELSEVPRALEVSAQMYTSTDLLPATSLTTQHQANATLNTSSLESQFSFHFYNNVLTYRVGDANLKTACMECRDDFTKSLEE